MRKNSILVWLIAGSIVVFGGFAFFACRLQPRVNKTEYDIAVMHLRSRYAGATTFTVSSVDDERTWIEKTPSGYALHGVMKTDHPELATNTKASPTGEIRFTVYMNVSGTLIKGLYAERFHFEPVK